MMMHPNMRATRWVDHFFDVIGLRRVTMRNVVLMTMILTTVVRLSVVTIFGKSIHDLNRRLVREAVACAWRLRLHRLLTVRKRF